MKLKIKSLPEPDKIEIRAFLGSLYSFIHKNARLNNANEAISLYFQLKPKRKTDLILNYLPALMGKIHSKILRKHKEINSLYGDLA